MKRLWRIVPAFALMVLAVFVVCDRLVAHRAAPHLFASIEAVPYNHVAVVLGTSHRMRGGSPNLFFENRIAAAAELYRAGKVRHLLVSGDNATLQYNEPRTMRRALINAGVDSAHITLDYAGFRTLDSVVRAREVFGQQRFTVVSQRFHTERAIFLARGSGIEAIGFNAPDVPAQQGFRTLLREKFARVKLFWDQLTGARPRFLGDPVEIPLP
jgi:SanA protein